MSRVVPALRSFAAAGLCILAVALAVVEVPVSGLIVVAAAGTGLGMTVEHLSRQQASTSARPWQRSRSESRPLAGCLGAVAAMSVAGLVSAIGWSGLAVAVLIAILWPGTALRTLDLMPSTDVTRGLRSILTRRPATSPHPMQDWPERLQAMSDGSICYVWGTSSQQLRMPLPAIEQLAIVMSRAHVLDELERRDPRGFAAWTSSSVNMALNPRRFIRSATGADRFHRPPGQDE